MNKEKITLLLVLLLILGSGIYWMVDQILTEPIIEQGTFPSDKTKTFHVSGSKGLPVFTKEIIIDPFDLKAGDKQIYSLWVKDPQGIEKVFAFIKTDKGEEVIPLQLVEGTKQEGRWMGSWITKDIFLQDSYKTVFQAINTEGEDTKVTIPWFIEKD